MVEKLIGEWKKAFLSDLPYVAAELKGLLKVPSVVILDGDLGSGKTTLVQSLITEEIVVSPTYSLLSEGKKVVHADFYRLKNASEIAMLEMNLYLEGKEYFFVEWGLPYLSRLRQEVPVEFEFYLVRIGDAGGDASHPSRNYSLYHLPLEP